MRAASVLLISVFRPDPMRMGMSVNQAPIMEKTVQAGIVIMGLSIWARLLSAIARFNSFLKKH